LDCHDCLDGIRRSLRDAKGDCRCRFKLYQFQHLKLKITKEAPIDPDAENEILQANVQIRAILRQDDKAKPITPLDLEPDRFRIQILVQVRSLAEPLFIPADILNNQLCFLYNDEDDDTQHVTTQDEFETALRYFREEGERPVRLQLERTK
jgi:hypothetical protein